MGAMEYFLGIDPGKSSGGLSVINSIGRICDAIAMKNLTDDDINDWILAYPYKLTILEQVGYMPGDGGRGAFSFGENFGLIKGILVANKIKREYVSPLKWQKEFGLIQRNKKLTKTQKKNINKAKAQELFPDRQMTHLIADACLIAEYARRLR